MCVEQKITMSTKTKDELEKLFATSADIGAILQQNVNCPTDGVIVLLITLGRLLAREGYSDMTAKQAWEWIINNDTKTFFDWGHQEERDRGHNGVPRMN